MTSRSQRGDLDLPAVIENHSVMPSRDHQSASVRLPVNQPVLLIILVRVFLSQVVTMTHLSAYISMIMDLLVTHMDHPLIHMMITLPSMSHHILYKW